LHNLENVLAIELMTAAQAVEFLKPLKCGEGTSIAYKEIRKVIKPLVKDRVLYYDIKKALGIVKDDSLLNSVETMVKLN
jgi:histidine ammonia-lyase